MNPAVHNIMQSLWAAFAPPLKLSLSEWADNYAYLSAESSAEAGRWHTIAYQKGIMDAFTDPDIEFITVMKSARVGYTKILNNVVGYHIHQDPCAIMVVEPTIEDAEGYSKEEIAPMLRDTPVLKGLVAEARSKDSNNTILQKNFPGGTLSMVGANSPRGFRRVSRRVVLFDEVDGYPASAGAEGDQIKLGIRRTEHFWNRKIAAGSTPTIKESSRIGRMYEASDQRRFFVPCPQCGEMQYLKFGGKDAVYGLKWPEGEPEKAYYVCEKNGCVIEHSQKRNMVARGEWRATAEGKPRHAGFHIWAAYSNSPNATWGHIAAEFLEAKNNPQELKTFVNTVLGEEWEEDYTAKLGAEMLEERAEAYNLHQVPVGGLLLTAGVDVQDNRVCIVVRAWGGGEESWLVNWLEIYGDPAQPELWQQVDNALLQQNYIHASGHAMRISAAAIDSGGHFTHEVYAFVRPRQKRHIIAIKGSSVPGKSAIGKPTLQDMNYKNQLIKRGVRLFLIGTNTIKNTIYSRMKLSNPCGAGVYHWPLGLPQEYYKQLVVEKQRARYGTDGTTTRVWVKKPGARNEAWDCEVYAYAALQYFLSRVNRTTIWEQLHKRFASTPTPAGVQQSAPDEPPPASSPAQRSPAQPRKRGGFVKGWRR